MNSVLVLGAAGQLGQCLRKTVEDNKEAEFIFPDRAEADILNMESLSLLFDKVRPAFVVNCAAYTAVDKAEDDIQNCRAINNEGAANVATLCSQYGATLIHVSTDFVFKGDVTGLLKETDATEPINIYGLTKLEGEQEIARILPAHYILRTSWLYSEYANNFVKTMIRLGNGRGELNVISDQVGTPTYAMDLAEVIVTIISDESKAYGIYHYSNEGVASWYDFATAIFELSNNPIQVYPIQTFQYPTRAERPKFSVMDKSKLKDTFSISIPHWRKSLAVCLSKLG
jgi:dTDP-4-dehydrorhamnose reductase